AWASQTFAALSHTGQVIHGPFGRGGQLFSVASPRSRPKNRQGAARRELWQVFLAVNNRRLALFHRGLRGDWTHCPCYVLDSDLSLTVVARTSLSITGPITSITF